MNTTKWTKKSFPVFYKHQMNFRSYMEMRKKREIIFVEAEDNAGEDLFKESEEDYDPEYEEYILLEADDKDGEE